MSTGTLLVGYIEFVRGLDFDEVKKIADDLFEYTKISPDDIIKLNGYTASYTYWGSWLTYTGKKRMQYTLHYNYVDWFSNMDEDRWEGMMKYLAKHAKKIHGVYLSLFYLQKPDRNININHEGLMELRIEQVSKQLLGDDEDEH